MPLAPVARDRVERNVERARHLVTIYRGLVGDGRGRREYRSSDLLRAAVVFLHAAVEELLRSIAADQLPRGASSALDSIPLVGLGPRPEKFLLGALADHRGESVEDVIQASVEAHLSRCNWNDTEEIAMLLRRVGVDPASVNGRFPDLAQMIERRH